MFITFIFHDLMFTNYGRLDLLCNNVWGVAAQWLVCCLASGGSQVRILLQPPHTDLGQVLHSQWPVALKRVRGSNPGQERILDRDLCSTCDPSEPSYDEYTDRTLSVRR